MKCLNVKNKEVKAALDELTTVLGSEDAAYYIMSENEGYAIDQAPNGEKSILFQQLLEYNNNNRDAAIKDKARMYSQTFQKSQFSTDENGEPLIDYFHKSVDKFMFVSSTDIFSNENQLSSRNVIENILQISQKNNIKLDDSTKSILSLMKNFDILIKLVDSTSTYMYYDEVENAIYVNSALFQVVGASYNFQSIAHELVHAFTSRQISIIENGSSMESHKHAIDMYESLKELYKMYSGIKNNSIYGLTDIHEFLAEILTNDEFLIDLLEFAQYQDNSNKLSNLIFNFLNKVAQLIDSIFGSNLSKPTVQDAITAKSIAFNFLLSGIENQPTNDIIFQNGTINSYKDIHKAKYQFEKYDFSSKEEFDRRMDSVRQNLLSGLQVRYKAIDDPDPARNRELKQIIQYQIKNLQNETIDTLTNIKDFVEELRTDMRNVAQEVLDAYVGNKNALTDEKLISLDRNYFGFYCKHANEIYNSLTNIGEYREYIGPKDYDKLVQELEVCKRLLDSCQNHVKRMQVQNAKRQMEGVALSVGNLGIYDYIRDNSDSTNNDISWFSKWFGSGDKINDYAVKSIYQIVQSAEDKINSNTFEMAHKLNSLLKKTGNRQYMLFELDDNGNPTGYIIRDRNYGKFYNDYKNAIEKIRKELGISPEELTLPENRNLRIEFNKRKNKWLGDHCERKFTNEYYDLLNGLSEEATNAREMIMVKIRDLTSKYKDVDGIIQYEKMSDNDWNNLQSYYIEKQMLSSIYDANGVEKPQGSIERQIADELTELNQKLSKGLQMKVNRERFEALRAKKHAELTPEEYKKWLQRNTRTTYADEFYKLLKKIERNSYGPIDPSTGKSQYQMLSDEKRGILDMYRDAKTGEINPDIIPNIALNRVNRIDIQLRALRKKYKKSGEKGEGLKFEDIAKVVPTERWYKDYNDALSQYDTNPEAVNVFLLQNANIGADEKPYPKSWYTKIVPKDSKYIDEYSPSLNFSEISEESPFYNKNYDRKSESNKDEYYQPKLSLYDNSKSFKKIMKYDGLSELRNALLDTMQLSQSKLTNMHGLNKYKLPQMSGSTYRFIKAYYKESKGIFNTLMSPLRALKDAYLDKVSVKNDDPGIQKKPNIAPDGTSLAMIPQYFVQDLKNPATISANLVGSVIMYYRMAENFEKKSEIKPKVEIIKSFLKQRNYTGVSSEESNLSKVNSWLQSKKNPKEGQETNTFKYAQKFIDMNVYDIRTTALTFTIKGREFNVTKALGILQAYGTLRNLGLNFACAFTGLFTAIHNHIMNMACGRYYSFSDAFYGFKDLLFDLFTRGINAGRKTYKSKQMAYMDYFEVGGTIDSLYKHTNRPTWLNILTENWAFGVYSMSDYLVKGNILNSVMYNFRNVNGEFICKEDYLNKYGNTPETQSKWNSYKTAKSSIDYIAGKVVVKDKKDSEAWEKARYRIGRTAQNLAASADGMLTSLQKAQFAANAFGALCMMHRQYIPLAVQEKWTMDKQYDYTTQRWQEASMKSVLRLFQANYKDQSNLKYWQKVSKLYKEDEVIKYNVKRTAIESAFILALYPYLAFLLVEKADEDKKNKLLNLFAYIMLRTSFESGAPYNLLDIYSTIKTPTPIYSVLDNFGGIPSYALSQVVNAISDKRNKKGIIKRGAYKGNTYLEKMLWQATPFKNVKELNDIPTKRNYYQKQIIGN